jgi:hypothetical protein
MPDYKVEPLNKILSEEDKMKKLKVSEVARSPNGFLGQYKKYKTYNNFKNNKVPNGLIDWGDKRNAFIDRHLAQYIKNPTERRRLAILVWGYKV